MNCPAHIQIYNHGLKSYRDLPLRLAEFGSCHRNEPSGTLHGLMRVRNFVQDDAPHLLQRGPDPRRGVGLHRSVVRGLSRLRLHRGAGQAVDASAQRVGDDALWDRAEKALADALDQKGLAWELQPGEGAFYGPKIEFSLRDCLDRVWQCGTIQLDFLDARPPGCELRRRGQHPQVPVMLHRAILARSSASSAF